MKIGEKDNLGRIAHKKVYRVIYCNHCYNKFKGRITIDMWGNILESPRLCRQCKIIEEWKQEENEIRKKRRTNV